MPVEGGGGSLNAAGLKVLPHTSSPTKGHRRRELSGGGKGRLTRADSQGRWTGPRFGSCRIRLARVHQPRCSPHGASSSPLLTRHRCLGPPGHPKAVPLHEGKAAAASGLGLGFQPPNRLAAGSPVGLGARWPPALQAAGCSLTLPLISGPSLPPCLLSWDRSS